MIDLYAVADETNSEKKKAQRPKRATWTVDPDKEAEELMQKAIELTGESRTKILLMCFHRDIKTVVREILQQREKTKKDFFSGGKDSSSSKG